MTSQMALKPLPTYKKRKEKENHHKCFLHAFSKTALSPSFPLAKVTKVTWLN